MWKGYVDGKKKELELELMTASFEVDNAPDFSNLMALAESFEPEDPDNEVVVNANTSKEVHLALQYYI